MKIRNIALALATGICLFASCSSETEDIVENTNNNVKVKKVLGVGTLSTKSRAYISDLNLNSTSQGVLWSETDNLSVFAVGHEGEKGDVFSWKSWSPDELHNLANFEGYTYDGASNYYILYPAQDDARLLSTAEGPRLKFNIPSVQNAVAGSFDPTADILVGKAASISTTLENVCAFFYITLPAGFSHVDISIPDNNDWHLAGTVTAEVGTGGALIKGFESDCTNKISLQGTEAGGTYFIAFIPTSNFHNSLNLTLYKSYGGGVMDYYFEKSEGGLSFTHGCYYNLGDYTPKP